MSSENSFFQYTSDDIVFHSKEALKFRTIYAPLCGTDSTKIKSSITPYLSGDIKIDKNRYITKPASVEDLRSGVRNFYIYVENKGVFSLSDTSKSTADYVEIGPLWHKLVKRFDDIGLQLEALNFIPVNGNNIELMSVKVTNLSHMTTAFTPTACIPLFARALENKHDHEHVTSLLNRIEQKTYGVVVTPTMLFNEQGHQANTYQYFVAGSDDQGQYPRGSFPTFPSFYGDEGPFHSPEAVRKNTSPRELTAEERHGKEAVGALRFIDTKLRSRESKTYYIIVGVEEKNSDIERLLQHYNSEQLFQKAYEDNKKFWSQKINSISFKTGDEDYNRWIKWVTLQPVLRRIFGCSFLPDHDYGKGGKGWRDIWQDLLSLILIEPDSVREHLVSNFAGVRIDGTNATIIGEKTGEFIADRNSITRVWMDHGVWPFLTTFLYINQTGDFNILMEEQTYFHDRQLSRATKKDDKFVNGSTFLKDRSGNIYKGTIIEHILLQNLVQFFNVGEHNITRLENADWNDGLDMASLRGESVTFMSLYAGNLLLIAELLEKLKKIKNLVKLELAEEMMILFDSLANKDISYDDVKRKQSLLFEQYFSSVEPALSGNKKEIHIEDIVKDCRKKADWVFNHIRKHEKINIDNSIWFNGYYDNQGKAVEGKFADHIRMTLTGQVFPIMSGLAQKEEIHDVVKSVKRYLKDSKLQGYRLNTDFKVDHYFDLGRAFGFAYGTKENGAFFSHMTVMYGYALYKRGFAKDGFDVFQSIYNMCSDTAKSKIYPGIPEYFDSEGRGRYHYLTGSASWFVLAQLTQVFGVRGEYGDLILDPKLEKHQFNEENTASVSCQFAGKKIIVEYVNNGKLDYGAYFVKAVYLNNEQIEYESYNNNAAKLKRSLIANGPSEITLRVFLD